MARRGAARARKQQADARKRGAIVETPAGVALAKRSVDPLAQAILEFIDEAMTGKGGPRATAALLLKDLNPHLVAYVAIRETLNRASMRHSLKATARGIANRIEDELNARDFEAVEPRLYKSVIDNMKRRGQSVSKWPGAVKLAAKHFGVNGESYYTNVEKLHLGTKLVELIIETFGIIKVELVRVGKHSTQRLAFEEKIESWMREYDEAAALSRPFYMPTVQPPIPWQAPKGGVYVSDAIRPLHIVTQPTRDRRDALDEAEMPRVYEALNALQETPWRVNKRVLAVMEQAWEMDAGLPCMPPRENEPIPEPPQEVKDDVKGGPHRKAWRRKAREIHERNARNRSLRFEFARGLALAKENADYEAIYFPYRLDFRGRCYAISTTLHPQGADEARSLLEFAEGKPLGERGLFWLGVHGANLFGNDKVSLEERYQWAIDHAHEVALVANDPLGNLWWTEADKPWCFLAWCFEWYEAYNEGPTFVSRIPIALDGSCNGLQHFSAMLRDPIGGAAVNLIPSEKPQDIYQRVADRVMEKLKVIAENPDDPMHFYGDGWYRFGINRSICKRPVMVLPYGGTYRSCLEYVRDGVRQQIADGKENPFGLDLPKATSHLAPLVWEAIGEVVVAARVAMDWLQKVAGIVTRAGHPVRWTTPTGFKVVQEYRKMRLVRVKTRFCGSLIYFGHYEETNKYDPAKNSLAISPNFVHSLDASALVNTVVECHRAGINSFAMIHDSYGTHAADTDQLAETLRRCFVDLYSKHDVLQELRDELVALFPDIADKLPPIPEKGTLDISEVEQSRYFFA